MALLGRHAAITRFGTDEFTGNVLFAVFLVLSIGLYCGFQSVIEDVFNRLQSLFRRREVMAIAETANGEKMHVSVEEASVTMTQYSEADSDVTGIEESNTTFERSMDKAPFEVLEVVDDMRHIRFSDGEEAYVGIGLWVLVYLMKRLSLKKRITIQEIMMPNLKRHTRSTLTL